MGACVGASMGACLGLYAAGGRGISINTDGAACSALSIVDEWRDATSLPGGTASMKWWSAMRPRPLKSPSQSWDTMLRDMSMNCDAIHVCSRDAAMSGNGRGCVADAVGSVIGSAKSGVDSWRMRSAITSSG
ncbi:hypothetical protein CAUPRSCDRAFT_12203 [Caulochytrium protostelioides]|uniref:Uncharacterized protein n=1 Tax=Caulochytrium protostelioides TaxID=1555241 RepID=A0A4P9WVE6_9FUNG|nr:hypothetical protein CAUPRSCDRAFT_12203 [Caulochytrium protostelioides]